MPIHLFDPALFDQLEGLNERYAVISRRLEQLQDQAASFDQYPEPGQTATLEALQQKVKAEAVAFLEAMLESLTKRR